MLSQQLILFIVTFLAGFGVSAGTFAFILVIGVIPRILRRCEMGNVMKIENIVISGVIIGNLLSIWNGTIGGTILNMQVMQNQVADVFIILWKIFGWVLLLTYGISTGIFVGCIAVALAEILHTFPILFRRVNLNYGLKIVVFGMAFGKLAGALFYFFSGYQHIG